MTIFKLRLIPFLASVAILGFIASGGEAMEENKPSHKRITHTFKNVQECLKIFENVDQKTLPTLLERAGRNDMDAVRQIRDFQNAVNELPLLGYKPQQPLSRKDKAVEGISDFLTWNQSDIERIISNRK